MHGDSVPVHEKGLSPFKAREGLLLPLVHGNSVPVHERDLVPLRREKASSPANAWGLCSRA